jgi:competence protein ComEA
MKAFYHWRRRFFLAALALVIGIWVSPMARGQVTAPIIDVNSADTATLTNLPGITPTLAKRIIKGRPYHTLQDLEGVKGLTEAELQPLAARVTFGTNIPASPSETGTNAAAGTGQRHTTKKAATNKVGPGEKININKASATELARLPGIGKSKAQAIVDYRVQNGDFKALEDIEKVKGIKAGLFAKLKDYIELSD